MEKEIKTTKPVARKRAPAKKRAPVSKVEMISYSIKMTIPTVAYGNVQPEIVVRAGTPEEAHDFIVPHLNKLWKEYYLVDGKRPVKVEPKVEVKAQAPKVEVKAQAPKVEPPKVEVSKPASSPFSSVALVKATQAINSCRSLEALELIRNQVNISVKLTEEDKLSLQPLLAQKEKELNIEKINGK